MSNELALQNALNWMKRAQKAEEQIARMRAGCADREWLGRLVRWAWIRWAETQPGARERRPDWFEPWDAMPEEIREADRQIGEFVADRLLPPAHITADGSGAKGDEVEQGV